MYSNIVGFLFQWFSFDNITYLFRQLKAPIHFFFVFRLFHQINKSVVFFFSFSNKCLVFEIFIFVVAKRPVLRVIGGTSKGCNMAFVRTELSLFNLFNKRWMIDYNTRFKISIHIIMTRFLDLNKINEREFIIGI